MLSEVFSTCICLFLCSQSAVWCPRRWDLVVGRSLAGTLTPSLRSAKTSYLEAARKTAITFCHWRSVPKLATQSLVRCFLLHPVMFIFLIKCRYIGSLLLTLDNSSPHYSTSQCGSVCVSWIIRLISRALGSLMCVLCQTQVQCCSAAARICCTQETKDE